MGTGYEWLQDDSSPSAWVVDGSCIAFVRGLHVQDVVRAVAVSDVREIDLASDSESPDEILSEPGTIAFFEMDGWTVAFTWTGSPAESAYEIAADERALETVLVYWDINLHSEFSYWRQGQHLVRLDGLFLEERTGEASTFLDEQLAMVERMCDENTSHTETMLALAEQLTGQHLSEDFLDREVTVGMLIDSA